MVAVDVVNTRQVPQEQRSDESFEVKLASASSRQLELGGGEEKGKGPFSGERVGEWVGGCSRLCERGRLGIYSELLRETVTPPEVADNEHSTGNGKAGIWAPEAESGPALTIHTQ